MKGKGNIKVCPQIIIPEEKFFLYIRVWWQKFWIFEDLSGRLCFVTSYVILYIHVFTPSHLQVLPQPSIWWVKCLDWRRLRRLGGENIRYFRVDSGKALLDIGFKKPVTSLFIFHFPFSCVSLSWKSNRGPQGEIRSMILHGRLSLEPFRAFGHWGSSDLALPAFFTNVNGVRITRSKKYDARWNKWFPFSIQM